MPAVTAALGSQFYDAKRNIYGYKPATYARSRAKLAAALAGTAACKIAHVGDSITYGSGATKGQASAIYLRSLLKSLGYPMVDGLVAPSGNAQDSRWVFGTGTPWTLITLTDSGADSTTAAFYAQANDTATTLSFTSTLPFTAMDVWQATAAGLTYQVDGGGFTSLPGSSGALIKTTVSGLANSTHTVDFKGAAANAELFGVRTYIPNASVEVANLGIPGATTLTWLDTAWQYKDAINWLIAYAPDLIFFEIGVNDCGTPARTAAQIAANIVAFQALVPNSDLVLVVSPPNLTTAKTAIFQQAQYTAADALGVAVLDMADRWGSYASALALGLEFGDGTHPNAAGNAEQAAAMLGCLAR